MPKVSPETARAKAEPLIKSYTQHGFNQTKTARALGVSQPTISNRLKKPAAKDALTRALNRIGITTAYKSRKFKELLESKYLKDCDIFIKDENGTLKINKNSNDFIETEDNNTRLGTLRLLCQVQGDIKQTNGNGKGNIVIQIVHGYRNGNTSPIGTIRPEGQPSQSA